MKKQELLNCLDRAACALENVLFMRFGFINPEKIAIEVHTTDWGDNVLRVTYDGYIISYVLHKEESLFYYAFFRGLNADWLIDELRYLTKKVLK